MIVTFIFGLAVTALLYYYTSKPWNYWRKRGVKQGKPYWIFGDLFPVWFKLKSFADFVKESYDKYPNSRYFGMYQFSKPLLVIKDPDLIKEIAIRAFDNFSDHGALIPDNDPLWSKNLTSLAGQKWHDARSIMSRNFTSGKMKSMFLLISECAQNFTEHFVAQKEDLIEFEAKALLSRFSTDVIATTAFGFKTDSLKEPENEFYLTGKGTAIITTLAANLKMIMFSLFPKLYNMLDIQLFDGKMRNFYLDIVDKNVKEREEKGIVRPDLIHWLLQAKNGKENIEEKVIETGFAAVEEYKIGKAEGKGIQTELTNMDIAAHAFIFFAAGFDSTTTLISFMCHELAVHPEVQDKLRKEIQKNFEETNGNVTYEVLMGMKYMDMVVSETLRIWMNFGATERMCTKKYTIQPVNPKELPLTVEPGVSIWMPIYAFHNDPKYYPDPHRFDPERFSDENKSKIIPYTYFPFGVGPRNCIGSRFAILKTKTFFFHLLMNFEIVTTSKTRVPIVRVKSGIFGTNAEGGLHLAFRKIRK